MLNVVPAKIVTHFELPVFFDCLDTILTAMTCGNMAALIGGGLGSILTYFLYGYSIGEGFSAPFAIALGDTCGLPDFWSQLLADIIIDVFDKSIVVISAVLLYRWIPHKIRFVCNDTFHIDPNVDELAATTGGSLLRRIVVMVIVAELFLGSLACAIGYFLYQKVSIDKFTDIANGVT